MQYGSTWNTNPYPMHWNECPVAQSDQRSFETSTNLGVILNFHRFENRRLDT